MNAVQRYGNVQAQTASKERLMVLLFETALKHMRNGAACFEAGQRAEGARLCTKASDILVELHATLDRRHAPELCDTLAELYRFCCARLLFGATTCNPGPVNEAARVFAPLVDGFAGAVEKVLKGAA
jgi:flagellar protein FliS